MRLALISDIHANAHALECALHEIDHDHVDMILSLGDQINLGPLPGRTMRLLKEAGAICLHGNHERYVLSSMAGDPAYSGANFESLRFTGQHVDAIEISLPMQYELEGILFCHAMPGDDAFPIHAPDRALPRLLALSDLPSQHIICGHGHNPTHYVLPHLTVDSIGSCGCMDRGSPGTAMYHLLTVEKGNTVLQPCLFTYDQAQVRKDFIEGGMASFCPIMARISCLQMTLNQAFLVPFVKAATERMQSKGESSISLETWTETDRFFPWPDGKTALQFWGQ